MKEESVFEQFVREKVENLRMQPSEKIWTAVRDSVSTNYSPRFHTLIILFWGIVFLNLYLPLGNMPPNTLQITPKWSTALLNIPSPVSQANTSALQIAENKLEKAWVNHTEKFTTENNNSIVDNINIAAPALIKVEIQENRMNKIPDASLLAYSNKQSNRVTTLISGKDKRADNEKFFDKLKQKLKLTDNSNGFQFYFTPSVSYRILYMDNKPYFNNNGRNPESSVSHYPATGLEAGVAVLRKISKRWRFRGGVQMNFSRYNINASKSNSELVYVSLSQNSGFERNTNLRNGNGLLPKKLMNENLQVSLPFGMEFMAAGNEKLSFNLAGTLQPSVSLHAGGYMVTTNFKNYIPAENIFRRYNLQTGVECFVKTSLGLIDLQAGPQLRYQLLSNTLGSYPIREHLIDYGFKIGIVKKIQ